MAGKPRQRGISRHQNYTVDEAARALKVHRQTVLRWLKAGLPKVDGIRPFLIRGLDLADFLARRAKIRKATCQLDQCYCLACRMPRRAAGREAEITSSGITSANIRAICEACGNAMFKRVSASNLAKLGVLMTLCTTQATPRLTETPSTRLDVHFGTTPTHAQAQRQE